MIENANKSRCFFNLFRTLETALAAEQTKVTTLETTVAASTTKITTLETALAALTTRFDNINSACLDDGARRLASAPCGGIKVPTTNDENSDTNHVLVQSLQFTGVQASALSSSSAKKNLESKIASAIGIDATRVNIISIKSVPIQKRQMRSLADDTGVEIVYEITIEGDTAALMAKGDEMSQKDSVVYTAVVEAVAVEAGVDASSVTMTSAPMEEAAPSVSNELSSSDTDTTGTTDNTDNANEMTIIIAGSVGGGSILIAMIVMYVCRRAKKQNIVVDDVKKTTSVVPVDKMTEQQRVDLPVHKQVRHHSTIKEEANQEKEATNRQNVKPQAVETKTEVIATKKPTNDKKIKTVAAADTTVVQVKQSEKMTPAMEKKSNMKKESSATKQPIKFPTKFPTKLPTK